MSSETASVLQHPSAVDSAWALLRAARALADGLDRSGRFELFGDAEPDGLRALPSGSSGGVLAWQPGAGWESRLPPGDPRSDLLNLYLPICSATSVRPVTVGHLGQSLDGFIATPSGDSQTITGGDNIVHLHRMRALCDAVVVGAGTVAADDPQLTTRHVPGPNPLRVVFDPGRRLSPTFRLFTDRSAPVLYICAQSRVSPPETHVGGAVIAAIEGGEPGDEAAQVLRLLRARGCARVFVEGGGVTVSRFLEANLLDRLQIAIAPILIGEGRPAVRLTPQVRLRDCRRPSYRVFRMGGDVLFDCDLTVQADVAQNGVPGMVNRVI
jgi:diaminohydroxyphosphoribosylaminopyrimidine deaminase / 5-amino-6-(5-phosphoribosylamino)uracil reductase